MTRKALFLDRDGVVNVDIGYLHTSDECVFNEDIFGLVRTANHAGYVVVLVTNQAGIGRGYFTVDQFHAFTDWMLDEFRCRHARIDRVYYCPHHPEFGLGEYRQACACRKPQSGMFEQARVDFDLDMQGSLMVGDKPSDLQAAARAGVAQRFLLAPAGEYDLELSAALGTRIDGLPELLDRFTHESMHEPLHDTRSPSDSAMDIAANVISAARR
ncbi:D-glycero-alpha-D-manno-heptose-1,7-bisphosphate 7-phosphatase [Paraburkholderia sp. ZP32-5]|uniref:D-glycero-alpha-D-manno-heptose-1,7-bisphosphate 7-phosphatase n=1 Tax=Paraburkholderia sp. ZP32-5 TaxID=2883245 RepID=UPI001F43989B|nr:HAD family hydrolase [Paraburkholderia sp. ZP32-5]